MFMGVSVEDYVIGEQHPLCMRCCAKRLYVACRGILRARAGGRIKPIRVGRKNRV
jgi:hypothetical protein